MNETTNTTTINDEHHLDGTFTISLTSKAIMLSVSCFLLLIGIPGNSLVIWTYASVKRLQSLQNAFVINLSVCDTIIIGYLLPLNMAAVIMEKCPLPGVMCAINGGITHVCFTTSVQNIMHIAIVRYVKICCQNNRFKNVYTTRSVCMILIGSWGVGIVFLIPLYFMDKKIIFDDSLHMCVFDRYKNAVYTIIYQTMCLAVPVFITGLCYVAVYRKVVKSRKLLSRHWNNGLARKKQLHENAVTRSQFAIFIAYMILYIPFGVTAIFLGDRSDVPDSFHAAAIYLCFINSCINGIIYGLLNSNIRRAYKEALSCILPRNAVYCDLTVSEDQSIHTLKGVTMFVTVSPMTQTTSDI